MCNHSYEFDGLPCTRCLAEGRYPCSDCLEAVAQHVCPICADLEEEANQEIILCDLGDSSLLPLWSTLSGCGFQEDSGALCPSGSGIQEPHPKRSPRPIRISPIWRWV